jgi:hypothetical protein
VSRLASVRFIFARKMIVVSGRSFVSRLLRLTLLAPDIQEAILDGRQAKGMQLEELTRAMPAEWGEQRQSRFQP